MHVLHRPDLSHVAAITAACAALALALTLLLGATPTDIGSVSASGPSAAPSLSVHSTSTEPRWNLTPFTSLLRSPVRVPWAAGSH